MSSGAISKRFVPVEKSRSAPCRLSISKITPLGGNSAGLGQRIRFHLPANRVGSYLDCENSFLSMNVKIASHPAGFGRGGVGSFFSDIIVRNGGQHLSTLSRNDLWRTMTTVTSIPVDYQALDGSIIQGMGGVQHAAGGVVFCDPLPNIAPIFRTGNYIPLFSADNIEIEMTFVSTLFQNLQYNGNTQVPTGLSFEDITLNLAIVEVSPEADKQIISANSGVFRYLVNNVGYFPHSIPAGTMNSIFNLGASYSSANKIDVCFTYANTGLQDKDAYDQFFPRARLSRLSLLVDGMQVLLPHISTSSSAVNLCMNRIANHGLCDYTLNQSSVKDGYANGSFVVSFDLETMLNKSGPDGLRSGLNLSSSISQLNFEFEGAGAEFALRVHTFVYFDALCSMDVSGTRNFEVSI